MCLQKRQIKHQYTMDKLLSKSYFIENKNHGPQSGNSPSSHFVNNIPYNYLPLSSSYKSRCIKSLFDEPENNHLCSMLP